MTNRQRISFDRIVRLWVKIIDYEKCPKCLNSLSVRPYYRDGAETLANMDYVLYICDKCNGEYHISQESRILITRFNMSPSSAPAPTVPVEREYECHFNAEDDK